MKKLTLSADPEIVQAAKKLAEARGISVSAMFSQFVQALSDKSPGMKVGPITRHLTGIAKQRSGKTDRELLEDALIRRHSR